MDDGAQVAWLCDPGSPWGQPEDEVRAAALLQEGGAAAVALDRAYAPLRLEPAAQLPDSLCQRCWQLWSPNKALGMTGVRAAYVVAPAEADPVARLELEQLAPAWPLGADGVALLHAWTEPTTQRWLHASLPTLAQWKDHLVGSLRALGWQVRDSVTPFVCARPPQPLAADLLRARGIKLRDASSFGLPGWWRLSAQPPQAVQALVQALRGLPAAELAAQGEP